MPENNGQDGGAPLVDLGDFGDSPQADAANVPADLESSSSVVLTPEELWGGGGPPSEAPEAAKPLIVDHPVGRPSPSVSWMSEIEILVSQGKWHQVVDKLNAAGATSQLPPALKLIKGIALKETQASSSESDRLTIDAVAKLLGVSPESPVALVVAKRAMRSQPALLKREAPRGSILFVFFALAIGGLVGWFSTVLPEYRRALQAQQVTIQTVFVPRAVVDPADGGFNADAGGGDADGMYFFPPDGAAVDEGAQ